MKKDLKDAIKKMSEIDPAWEQLTCKHPPERLFAWRAYDDTLCVGCCECGEVLKGGIVDGSEEMDTKDI